MTQFIGYWCGLILLVWGAWACTYHHVDEPTYKEGMNDLHDLLQGIGVVITVPLFAIMMFLGGTPE